MSRYLNTITDTISNTLGNNEGRNLVTDLATHAVRALGLARAFFLVRLMGFSPLQLQAVAVRRLQPAAHAHRLHCSHAMWQRGSWRPVKPVPGAKSRQS